MQHAALLSHSIPAIGRTLGGTSIAASSSDPVVEADDELHRTPRKFAGSQRSKHLFRGVEFALQLLP